MRKMTKLFFGMMMAVAITMSSCIDNSVAPEIKELRAAQVAYLQAQARLEEADAAAQEIANAYAEANNAILLQSAQADLDEKIADLQTALAEAELELQEAIDELAEYLAEHGLELAAEYLAEYSDAMDDVFDMNTDILDQIVVIGDLEFLLEPGNEDYDLIRERLDRDLVMLEAELELENSILAAMVAVAADNSAAGQIIVDSEARIQEIENEIEAVTVAQAQFEHDVYAPAYNAYYMAVGGNSYWGEVNYDGVIPSYEDAEADSYVYMGQSEQTAMNIAAMETQVGVMQSFIDAIEPELEEAVANYEASVTAYETAQATFIGFAATVQGLQADLRETAETNFPQGEYGTDALMWAQASFQLNMSAATLSAASAARNAAEQAWVTADAAYDANHAGLVTARDAAGGVVTTEQGELNTAQTNFDNDPSQANLTALQTARTEFAAAEADFDTKQAAVDMSDDAHDDAEDAKDDANDDYDDAVNDNDNKQNNYDNLVAGDPVLFGEIATVMQPVVDSFLNIFDDVAAAEEAAMIAEDVMDSAEDTMEMIGDVVNNFETNIENIEDNIADEEEDLADQLSDLAIELAIMAELQAEYDALTPEAISALDAANDAASDAYDDFDDEIAMLDDEYEALDYLVGVLEDNIDNLNAEIEDQYGDVEDLEDDVVSLRNDLSDNVISEQEARDILANEQGYLAQLQQELTALQALAAEWLALYTAAVGG